MRKLAIAMALSSTVLATPALARDGAVYVGGEFGAMIVEDMNVDIATRSNALVVDHDYGYDGALFAGYDLGAFRIELEASQKKADVESFQQTGIRVPGYSLTGSPTLVDPAVGFTRVQSLMLNGMLDFGDDDSDDGISGFVGGGIGMARIKQVVGAFGNQPGVLDDSDSGMAWQVIAGVRQALGPNIEAQLKYRFFNMDNIEMLSTAGNGGDTDGRFRSHSILGGLVFNFGGPAPIATQTCWNGAVIPVTAACPIQPPPPVQTQVCPNGTTIPVTATCPPAEVRPVGPFIVFFDWDKDDITPQAAAILDNAAAAYQQAGQAQVMLAGHADRSGSDQYNVGLSQRRAANVRAYLAGRGIPDGVMTTEAFGESRPLVETADGVREPQNRRVEITYGPGSGW